MHTKVISGFSLIALSGTGARTTACALIGLQKRALRESRGEGYSLSWPTRGGCALKWYLFQASDIWKGSDFTRWNISKGRKFCHLGMWKGLQGLTYELYDFIEAGKRSMTMHLQQLKEMQSSKRGVWKGYHLSIEGIRKGKGLDLGVEPPRIKICWVPPGSEYKTWS